MSMAEIKVNNLLKFYVLLLLRDGPRHGYEIIKHTGEKLGRKVGPGQIYPFLSALQKQGIVRATMEGKREKKAYLLTSKGEKFVLAMLSRFGELIDLSIKPRISVCSHCGCKVYAGGHEEKIAGKRMVFCCSHCARDFAGR